MAMDRTKVMAVIFHIIVRSQASSMKWAVEVVVDNENLGGGKDSDFLLYSILFKEASLLPMSHLLVSSHQPLHSKENGSHKVDYCNDEQRGAFLAIERSTKTILTGFWIADDKTFLTLECSILMCNISRNYLSTESSAIHQESVLRDERSVIESNDSSSMLLNVTRPPTSHIFHVSILMVVDYATIKAHCRNWPECCQGGIPRLRLCGRISIYYRNMMAAATQFYASIDNTQMQIRLYLSEVLALPAIDGKSQFDELIINGTDIDVMSHLAFHKAVDIIKKRSFVRNSNRPFVVSVFFVPHQLKGLENKYDAGLAYYYSVCHEHSVALVTESFAYRPFFTFVHELSHMLGSEHDGKYSNCGPTENRLMASAPNREDTSKRFHFSCCSLASMYKFLQEAKCVSSPPDEAILISHFNPNLGEVLDRPGYCRLAYGRGFKPCSRYDNVCDRIYCGKNESECFHSEAFPALNGMSCSADDTKWCMHGHCIQKGEVSFKDDEQKNCDLTAEIQQTVLNSVTSSIQKTHDPFINNTDATRAMKKTELLTFASNDTLSTEDLPKTEKPQHIDHMNNRSTFMETTRNLSTIYQDLSKSVSHTLHSFSISAATTKSQFVERSAKTRLTILVLSAILFIIGLTFAVSVMRICKRIKSQN